MLWRRTTLERGSKFLHDKDFKDVELEHMLADNCAM